MKKIMSLLLAVIMVVSLLPVTAFAENTDHVEEAPVEEIETFEKQPETDPALAEVLTRIEALPSVEDFSNMTKDELQAVLDEVDAIFTLTDTLTPEQQEQIDFSALTAMYAAYDYIDAVSVANPTPAPEETEKAVEVKTIGDVFKTYAPDFPNETNENKFNPQVGTWIKENSNGIKCFLVGGNVNGNLDFLNEIIEGEALAGFEVSGSVSFVEDHYEYSGKDTTLKFYVENGKLISIVAISPGYLAKNSLDGTYINPCAVRTWSALQDAINAATETTTIKLTQNLTAPAEGGASITIPAGKNITLDLNGCVLNRGLISSDGTTTQNDNGCAILVEGGGSLTLTDSGTTATHKFKVLENGLWVLDETNGTKTITGGVITGGTGKKHSDYLGGGIYNSENGSITIMGGNIVGNFANKSGGGVYSYIGKSFRLEGGTICGNLANTNEGGGLAIAGPETGIMTGGIICNNTAKKEGGGIALLTTGTGPTMYMTGGVITENIASGGAGVGNNQGTVYFGGDIIVAGNKTHDGSGSDYKNLTVGNYKLYCCDGTSGYPAPTGKMKIGVDYLEARISGDGFNVKYLYNFYSNSTKYPWLMVKDGKLRLTKGDIYDFPSGNGLIIPYSPHGSVKLAEGTGNPIAKNTTVSGTVTADSGYALISLKYNSTEIKPDDKGNFSFKMPSEGVTLTAVFGVDKPDKDAPGSGEGYTIDYEKETLVANDGYEVSSSNANLVSLTNDAITPGSTYYVRAKEDDTYDPSPWTEINVPARPAAPQSAPELDSKTDTTVTIKAVAGQEYSKDNGTTWVDVENGKATFTGLTADTSYSIITRVKAVTTEGSEAFASASSTALSVKTMKAGGNAPNVAVESVTDTTITLPYDATYEYKLGDGNWQNGEGKNVFTGLTAATKYTVNVRVKENTGTDTAASAIKTIEVYTAYAKPAEGKNYTIKYAEEEVAVNLGYEISKSNSPFIAETLTNAKLAIEPGTTYYFRHAALTSPYQIPASETVTLTIPARPAAPESAPVLDSKTDTTVIVTAVAGQEYSKDNGTSWVSDGGSGDGDQTTGTITFTGLTANTPYSIITRVKAVTTEGSEAFASANSTALSVTTKTAAAAAPGVTADNATVTKDTVTLPYEATYEYKLGNGDWQNGTGKNVFANLESATQYTFEVRVMGTDTAMPSQAATVKVCTTPASIADTGTVSYTNETFTPGSSFEISKTDVPNFTALMLTNGNVKLEPSTTYYIRKGASDGFYASEAVTLTIPARPAAPESTPELDSKTDTTITVTAVEGQEYSINGGTSWVKDDDNDGKITFNGLTEKTKYEVITRYKAVTTEGNEAFASENSEASVITTNSNGNGKAKADPVDVIGSEIKSGGTEVLIEKAGEEEISDDELKKIAEKINEVLDNETVKEFDKENDESGLIAATETSDSAIVEALKATTEDETAKGNVTDANVSKYLNVELVSAGVNVEQGQEGTVTVTEMVFDVTPMATITVTGNDGQVTLTTEITNNEIDGKVKFLLPVDSSVEAETAAVYHEGEFIGNHEIKDGEYIEVETESFSQFGYILLNEDTAGAKINDTTLYASLSDALIEVEDGETIKLLKDSLGTLAVSRKISFTLEKNDHTATIVAGEGYVLTVNGNVYSIDEYKPEHRGNHGSSIVISGKKSKEQGEENPDTGAPVMNLGAVAVVLGAAYVLSKKH